MTESEARQLEELLSALKLTIDLVGTLQLAVRELREAEETHTLAGVRGELMQRGESVDRAYRILNSRIEPYQLAVRDLAGRCAGAIDTAVAALPALVSALKAAQRPPVADSIS